MAEYQGPPAFVPVQALGKTLVGGMVLILAGIGARAVIDLLGMGDSGPRPSTAAGHGLDAVIDVAIFAWSIVFLIWFRRARINADSYGYRQRRAVGWVFWGWVIPIVNLWFPFQMMGDIWRAGLPPSRQSRTAWLPALWWTAWLLSGFSFTASAGNQQRSASRAGSSWPLPHIGADTSTVRAALIVITGALLIAIIRAISSGPLGTPLPAAEPDGSEPLNQQWPLPN
jgi:Domain of unknown function (DUF4328)